MKVAGELYEVILYQEYYGQLAINRWNYYTPEAIPGNIGSTELLKSMEFDEPAFASAGNGSIAFALSQMQASEVKYVSCSVRAIYNVLDFVEIGYPPTNSPPPLGPGVDPFTAYGFRTNRVRQDIGRGYKRFTGVQSAFLTAGGTLNATGVTRMGNVVTAMNIPFVIQYSGDAYTFNPCIVSKTKADPTAVPPVVAGHYYPTLAEQEQHIATGITWQTYATVRSQVSRQRGKGS